MRVKELIEILSKHPNPDAEILLRFNIGNVDDEDSDLISNEIEVWGVDNFNERYVELFSYIEKPEVYVK